ncbi:hypothetical protein O0L34_g13430 [Tuta absoluta]|nr:hypothetical protein O0L34_g13430 [Tuta absoluta]
MQDNQLPSELSSFLDPQKVKEDSISQQMRDFYKKLLQTDAQIKNLKKGLYNPSSYNTKKDAMYRLKRSLFHSKTAKPKNKAKPKAKTKVQSDKTKAKLNKLADEAKEFEEERKTIEGHGKKNKAKKMKTTIMKTQSKRIKRFENGSIVPDGYIFEKKEIMIKILSPGHTKKFHKCSHVPKQKADKEEQNPYKKNSERVDELLGEFLLDSASEPVDSKEEYNTPEEAPTSQSFPEPFTEFTNAYATEPKKLKNDFVQHGNAKREIKQFWNPNKGSAAEVQNNQLTDLGDDMEKKEYNDEDYFAAPQYDSIMGLSQQLGHSEKRKKSSYNSKSSDKNERIFQIEKIFKIPSRKLQQSDEQEEDEEGLGYEDFKEVLTDESDGHDETDRQVDRNRRDYVQEKEDRWKEVPPPITLNPPGVFNPNWKGPVPLYPDELSSIIRTAFETSYPTEKPVSSDWPVPLDIELISSNVKDRGHLVDVLRNKPEESLSNLAQAYSDYGVLSENIHNNKIGSSSNSPLSTTLQHMDVDDDEHFKTDTDDEDEVRCVSTTTVVNKYPFHVVPKKNNFNKNNRKPNIRSKREDFTTPTSIEKVVNLKENKEVNKNAETNIAKAFNDFLKDLKVVEQSTDVHLEKQAGEDVGIGDFLGLISNWFGSLAFMSENTVNSTVALAANVSNLTSSQTKQDKQKDTKETYPIYDSDMVDNIGHRSRVLMSIEEDRSVVADSYNSSEENIKPTVLKTFDHIFEAGKITNHTTVVPTSNTTISNAIMTSNNTDKIETKRSVRGEEDFVFWNDMYDDEYGIKIDPLDEKESSGHTKRNEGVVKKSADWIQNKMRQMSDTFRKKTKVGLSKMKDSKRENRDTEKSREKNTFKYNNLNRLMHKITKRDSVKDDLNTKDIPTKDYSKHSNNFAVMTAHMKDVCKQAADAVQKIRSIKPREDHESEMSRSLMQNLVKLMSDLVDYEVQQRTCLSLPSDLKDFLDWLTNPVPIPAAVRTKNVQISYPNKPDITGDQLIDIATTQSSEREDIHTDARSECLGTLLAVQDLMMDYSKLSDADKSKMFGVKEYLQDQLDFLNKQIGNSDDLIDVANAYSKELLPVRKRRDLLQNPELLKNPEFLRRRQYRHLLRPKRRFLKNYIKKHTKSTANNFESAHISTEVVNRITKIQNSKNDGNYVSVEDDEKDITKRETESEKEDKRSLPNVYYRALEDARKTSSTPREGKIVTLAKNIT